MKRRNFFRSGLAGAAGVTLLGNRALAGNVKMMRGRLFTGPLEKPA